MCDIELVTVTHKVEEEMISNSIPQLWSKRLHLRYTKHVNKHINENIYL